MVKRSRKKKKKRNPAADLILEILSRLPVKSVFRFKCVSKLWRDLINNPDHRRMLPQTLAGVFHLSIDSTRFPVEARHFTNVSEISHSPLIRPSLSFLPGHEHITRILDACNGLLLCRLRFDSQSASSQDASLRYAVCNPAIQNWVILPDSGCGDEWRLARLGFDPDVSLDIYVFEVINDDDDDVVEGVQIYSSRTRAWSYKESQWDHDTTVYDECRNRNSVFLNGFLHLVTCPFGVVAVDVEGEAWRMLTVPDFGNGIDVFDWDWEPGFLGQYQGQLCYINECDYHNDMSVWILKDYTTGEWILKHQVSIQKLCEKMMSPPQSKSYSVITVHPNCNLILYTAGLENTLMAYHIDREEAWVIKSLGSQSEPPYIPYVPFYSEALTEGHS